MAPKEASVTFEVGQQKVDGLAQAFGRAARRASLALGIGLADVAQRVVAACMAIAGEVPQDG